MDIPKKVLIVGLGLSGASAARFFSNKGSLVTVTDTKPAEFFRETLEKLKDCPIAYHFGSHPIKLFEEADLIVPSPGVSLDQPGFKKAQKKKIPICGDIEIASRFLSIPIIAVTGTNGKSTTVTLLHEILKNGDKRVLLGGNIGIPVLDLVESAKNNDLLILELSSFQLDTIVQFKPTIGVLLNITEDHLDRYKKFSDYVKAKGRLLKNMSREGLIVANNEDKNCRSLALKAKGKSCFFSTHKNLSNGLYSLDDTIHYRWGKLKEDYKIRNSHLYGIHNKENMMACIAIARYLGVSSEKVQYTLDSFLGLPHRNEFVREVEGIKYFNDSKATNVSASEKSLAGFPDGKVILIMGGRGKKSHYKPLAKFIRKKVKRCYLIGEAAPQMKRELGSSTKFTVAETLEKAVFLASHEATWGDFVLFSPAATSLDQFRNYEHRGDTFKGQVMRL